MTTTPPNNLPTEEQPANHLRFEDPFPDIEPSNDSTSEGILPEGISSSRRSRRVALVGIYAALILALDYFPGRPPNVEFMTCLLFVAGFCFGSRTGCSIALVVSAIFSYLNPLGPSQPSLLLFQVIFYVGVAFAGSVFANIRQRRPFVINGRGSAALGALGLSITLIFDIGSTFAFGLPLTNWNWTAVWPFWFSGIVFTIIHIVSNAIIFAFLLPVVANGILSQYGTLFAEPERYSEEKPDYSMGVTLQ